MSTELPHIKASGLQLLLAVMHCHHLHLALLFATLWQQCTVLYSALSDTVSPVQYWTVTSSTLLWVPQPCPVWQDCNCTGSKALPPSLYFALCGRTAYALLCTQWLQCTTHYSAQFTYALLCTQWLQCTVCARCAVRVTGRPIWQLRKCIRRLLACNAHLLHTASNVYCIRTEHIKNFEPAKP